MNEEKPQGPDSADEPNPQLDEVIAAYLQARDEGWPFDRQAFLSQHPEFADELNRFFESDDQVEWLVTSVVPAVAAEGAWFGPYRVVRRISRGGMGIVYEALEPKASKRVALKVLPTFGLPDPTEQERFQREIQFAGKLDHPHIVPVLECGMAGGIPYCTMELIEGQDLRTVIRCLGRAPTSGSDPDPDRLSNTDPAQAAVFQAIGLSECGLSSEILPVYWRFVARVGSQAARALAHAHSREILHRDIKPSNLLLNAQGDIRVTDFGLAKAAEASDLTETGNLAGTLRYLAPERLEGWCGPWSDIYSLGLTLYELLVLHPAFETLDRGKLFRLIATESPRRPRAVNPLIPRDLESIVLRAIEKEPRHRYPTAAALAEDLDRFLAGRPIRGRPVSPWRRAVAWTRRNPTIAGSLGSACLVLLIAVIGILFGLLKSRDAAESRAREAQAQRQVAETARRESEYQSVLLKLQQIRLLPHKNGWSQRAEAVVHQAVAIRADSMLRDQAAATFAGLDARLVRHLEGTGASAVAFDHEGKRLLIGGLEPDAHQDGRAKILDLTSDKPPVSRGLVGPGPVIFRSDGTPLQLVVAPEGGLVLWDLDRQRVVTRIVLPVGSTPGALAIRQDGSTAAASITQADGRGFVLVWDVEPCQLRYQFPGKATALAFAGDGDLLARGDEDGRIEVRTLRDGTQVAALSQGRNTIHGFGFTRNPRRDQQGNRGWLLGSADSGGTILVWDLSTKYPIARCNGSPNNVYSLAFSPDGAILASAGRAGFATILWDWAASRPLLTFGAGTPNASIVFSSDGGRIAVGQAFLHDPGYSHVYVFDLERARGIQTLPGLTAPVQVVLFSPDGRMVAALSHDWRLGIWDVATGQVVAILEAPKGYTTDNAGVAFSSDSRQLAACAGREARLWDLASGRLIQSWGLPPGLLDQIVFSSQGQLLVFRYETRSGARVPYGHDTKVDPIVCRLRNLLGKVPLNPQVEFRQFNQQVSEVLGIPNGPYFIISGSHDGTDGQYSGIIAMDATTGKELWSQRWSGDTHGSGLAADYSQKHIIIGFLSKTKTRPTLHDVLTGRELRSFDGWPGTPGPDWKYLLRNDPNQQGVAIHDNDGQYLVTLGIDRTRSSSIHVPFSSDGRHIAWGNQDGSVMIADLDAIQSRLAQTGLGW